MFVQLFSCLLSVCCRWSSLSSCRLHVTHLQAVWQDIVKAKQNCTRSSWTSPRAAEDGLKLYYLHRGTGLLDEEPPRLRGKATSLQEWLGARCMYVSNAFQHPSMCGGDVSLCWKAHVIAVLDILLCLQHDTLYMPRHGSACIKPAA